MAVKEYNKKSEKSVSANFKAREFDCKGNGCCNKTLIDEQLVKYLQRIRNHFEKPITINSGYRCAKHNKAIGGVSGSKHTKGMAADIVIKDVKPSEVAKYAESIGVLGIGLYETAKDGYFVHIDTRTAKSFWHGKAQSKRTTFGGENIIKVWQAAALADGYKLTADGAWGKNSIAIAKKAVCKKQIIGYKNKNLTKVVQNAVGVSADGKYGNNTKNAVIKWQKLMGLTADGIVGYNTWCKILGV